MGDKEAVTMEGQHLLDIFLRHIPPPFEFDHIPDKVLSSDEPHVLFIKKGKQEKSTKND
jgi:hypothetical protein